MTTQEKQVVEKVLDILKWYADRDFTHEQFRAAMNMQEFPQVFKDSLCDMYNTYRNR